MIDAPSFQEMVVKTPRGWGLGCWTSGLRRIINGEPMPGLFRWFIRPSPVNQLAELEQALARLLQQLRS